MLYLITSLVCIVVLFVIALTIVFAVLDDLAKEFDEDWTR